MSPRRNMVFLERQNYRRRRLIDMIRLLPVIGALLWAVPLLWPDENGEVATSDAVIFIFLVWAGLVVAGAMLSRTLQSGESPDGPDGGDGAD